METQTRIENLKPFGRFSTHDDNISVFIPVSSEKFVIDEPINISSGMNALLIRITDGTSTNRQNETPTFMIKKDYKLSEIFSNVGLLKSDKQLLVIIYNSTKKIGVDEIPIFKNCIESLNGNYHANLICIDLIRKSSNKDDEVNPDNHKGDIIYGL